jgi:hypothetical protein
MRHDEEVVGASGSLQGIFSASTKVTTLDQWLKTLQEGILIRWKEVE